MISAVLTLAIFAGTPSDCRDAYDRLELRSALLHCQESLSTASPVQLPELYRLLGMSFAALGDEARASAAFASLLAIDPAADLARGVSPKVRAVFDEVRRRSGGRGISLATRAVGLPQEGAPVILEVEVDDGSTRPVARVTARSSEGTAATGARTGAGPVSLELPPPTHPGPWSVDLRGVDVFGGALTSQRLELEVTPRVRGRSAFLSWKPWSVAALVLGGSGVALGVYSNAELAGAQSERVATIADERFGRASHAATGANVTYAVATGAAITGFLLWLTQPSNP